MELKNNYYFSSFFWSTFQKILNAAVGFISVPLLLGYYGKAEYGILGIATACNGYMHLLDLGMNVGAIKFFSQWKTEGKKELLDRVARTNITFYGIIALINIVGLVALAIWGEKLFAVTHEQFLQLRICLFVIALFSVFSWASTTFRQLLVAHMQISYTMQVQCVMTVLKALLIGAVFFFNLSLTQYFFWLTGIVSMLIIPFAIQCHKLGILNSFRPATYWSDFKIVLTFSLSIFALSLFQMTSTQSRPIILSIFADNGAEAVADFRIVEVVPQLIIMICGTFSSIFLPKASELVANRNQNEIEKFAYKWTIFTTILANCICFPILIGGGHVIAAFVGRGYEYLTIWLFIWTVCVLLQIHSTPTNSLILSYGKTKVMVYVTATACVVSMVINAYLAKTFSVGSAVIGYTIYIIINLFSYYGFYYKRTLHISNKKIALSFLNPTLCGFLAAVPVWYQLKELNFNVVSVRVSELLTFSIKTLTWLVVYGLLIFSMRIVKVKNRRVYTKYDITS